MWQYDDWEFIARNDASACCLNFLDEQGIVGSVLYLVGDAKRLPLDDGIVVAHRINNDVAGRLQLFLAGNEKKKKKD